MTSGFSIGNRLLRWPTLAALSGALLASCNFPVHSRFARYAPASGSSFVTPPAAEVDLVVAATTDVHGRLRSWDYYADAPESVRGLTRAATVVDSVRGANPGRVLLVDANNKPQVPALRVLET